MSGTCFQYFTPSVVSGQRSARISGSACLALLVEYEPLQHAASSAGSRGREHEPTSDSVNLHSNPTWYAPENETSKLVGRGSPRFDAFTSICKASGVASPRRAGSG